MKKYDYILVGSGLYSGVFAWFAKQKGKKCLVLEKRDHIGGNVYCENTEGIHVHKYGAHIFHTSNKEVWQFVNSLAEFNRYTNSPVANYKGEMYNMPFNMNTFSKSLAPAIRISYMVLPRKLMEHYIARANFYSNSASSCEQYALARFIENGSFERHLSRLKKYYRQEGERLLRIIKQSSLIPSSRITGGSCGTHLLVYLDTSLTDVEIRWAARSKGINLACLSEFCTEIRPEYEHVLVLNYCDLDERTLAETVRRLGNIFIQW